MKKTLLAVICLGMLLCSACASVFSAEYYDSYPFTEGSGDYESQEQEIRNYAMLRSAIIELVSSHTEQANFRFGSYNGSLIDDLAAVCVEVKNDNPLGAYAVQDISYDTSRIVSYYTADITISYKKSAQEIAAVESVSGLGAFGNHVYGFLEIYGSKTVVKVYSSVINEDYIAQLIADYCREDLLLAVVEPSVTVESYPDSGAERIYEISLSYGPDRDSLLEMDELLSHTAQELAASAGNGTNLSKALNLALGLADLAFRQEENSEYPGTAYGTLIEGSRHPGGLARAYKLLCDCLGIECLVVEGERNDDGVGDHFWNIINIDGEYYHVDISRFASGPERAFLMSDEDFWGEYYWSKDDYPRCSGSLGPESVFDFPEEEHPQPTPTPDDGPTPEPEPEPDEGEEKGNEEENENN